MNMIWPQDSSKPVDMGALASGEWLRGTERLVDAIHGLQPHNDSQRALHKRAADLAGALLRARWLVTDASGASIPVAFLVVLIFWLMIIFASFGLFAPRNAMVIASLFVCALSVGGAVFLVLEMGGPFDGLLTVSPDPVNTTVHVATRAMRPTDEGLFRRHWLCLRSNLPLARKSIHRDARGRQCAVPTPALSALRGKQSSQE